VRSKKYQDLVKKSGSPMPSPVIMTKTEEAVAESGDLWDEDDMQLSWTRS